MKKLIRLKKVCELTGLCRSEIYRLMSLGRFQKKIPLGERAIAFTEESIEEWIQSRIDLAA